MIGSRWRDGLNEYLRERPHIELYVNRLKVEGG
jgi:hypothetical protein